MYPRWDELTDLQRSRLRSHASSFGIQIPGGGLILPGDKEAYGIAVEMYSLSRAMMTEKERDNGQST